MTRTQHQLRIALGMSPREWKVVQWAAKDCHLDVHTYCRIMVLCASGQGGVYEHCDRAIAASAKAEDGR